MARLVYYGAIVKHISYDATGTYMYIYIYTTSQKYLATHKKFYFSS